MNSLEDYQQPPHILLDLFDLHENISSTQSELNSFENELEQTDDIGPFLDAGQDTIKIERPLDSNRKNSLLKDLTYIQNGLHEQNSNLLDRIQSEFLDYFVFMVTNQKAIEDECSIDYKSWILFSIKINLVSNVFVKILNDNKKSEQDWFDLIFKVLKFKNESQLKFPQIISVFSQLSTEKQFIWTKIFLENKTLIANHVHLRNSKGFSVSEIMKKNIISFNTINDNFVLESLRESFVYDLFRNFKKINMDDFYIKEIFDLLKPIHPEILSKPFFLQFFSQLIDVSDKNLTVKLFKFLNWNNHDFFVSNNNSTLDTNSTRDTNSTSSENTNFCFDMFLHNLPKNKIIMEQIKFEMTFQEKPLNPFKSPKI